MLFMAFLSKTLVIVQWLNGAEKKLKYITLFPGLIKTNERIVLAIERSLSAEKRNTFIAPNAKYVESKP